MQWAIYQKLPIQNKTLTEKIYANHSATLQLDNNSQTEDGAGIRADGESPY